MSRWRWSGCSVLVLALACQAGQAQSRLESLRRDTRGDSAPGQQPSRNDGSGSWWNSSWNPPSTTFPGDGWVGAVIVAGATVTSPIWAPLILLQDDFDNPAGFPGRPYALPNVGYLQTTHPWIDNTDREWLDADYLKPWGLRLSVEDGNDFNGLNRLGAAVVFDTTSRFGLSSRWDWLTEQRDGRSDETLLGDAHLTFRLAQATWAQFYLGAGARWLIDSHRKAAGFSAIYGADFFPIDPVIISTSVDLGNLDSAFAIRGRLAVGVRLGRWEAFAGYDHQRIGDVRITGPMLGLRRWF